MIIQGRSFTLARAPQRFLAKTLDYILITLVSFVLYPVGPLIGFLYSLFMDAYQGQSIGKRVLKIQAYHLKTMAPVSRFLDSFSRNAPFAVATFFAMIPLWGWIILILLGVPLMGLETYLILVRPRKQRLGDIMADTVVINLRQNSLEERPKLEVSQT
jgi:uncharacterized RDD family membrane protein YckC